MGTLQIGRVGIDVALDDAAVWNIDGDIHTVGGYLASSTLANTKDLRTELVYQLDKTIPVLWSTDASFDGFYILRSVTITSDTSSLHNTGYFPFQVTLERIGGAALTEFQSQLTTAVMVNDHGLVGSELHPFHGLPAAHELYEGDAELGSITRSSADGGGVTVYRQIAFAAGTQGYDLSPNWSIAPDDFYDGAVVVKVGGRIRSGKDTPLDVTDWALSNGIIRVTPGTSGRLSIETWDGSSDYHDPVDWKFQIGSGPTTITSWNTINVIRNDPEASTVRLINDQAPSGGAHRSYVDLTLRRGAVFVAGYWYFTEGGAAQRTMKIVCDSTEAGTTVTPTGASSAVAVRATSNDTNGDRYIVGSAESFTADTTEGGLSHTPPAGDHTLPFFLGTEINGSSAQTGDDAANVCLQALAVTGETVKAVRR